MSETIAQPGRLVLAATPIGDRRDASPRLIDLLGEADVIAAEDTRRLRRLLADLGVTRAGRVVSHHEHNESASAAGLVGLIAGGATVLLVSDAGMPTISDPGYRVVRAVLDAGLPVTAVPGPSAVLTALAVSGLPTDRFSFEGFPPRKAGERARVLGALASDTRTMVFFEAPHRLHATLRAMAEAFGVSRPAAVCRELTKTYEEVIRGSLSELVDWAGRGNALGEVTVVVSGADECVVPDDPDELVTQVELLVAQGQTLKAATKEVAQRSTSSARALYEAVIQARGRGS